jgi:GNAT superfamily N-acetyltransferase
MEIQYREMREIPIECILALYQANEWSAAKKPAQSHQALLNSHTVISAWHGEQLVGLGNAISDGHLVVYYPHLLVHPEYQKRLIGTQLMQRLMAKYEGFHQQMLVAVVGTLDFYRKCGFERAGRNEAMWLHRP